jgi:hypothetical protein
MNREMTNQEGVLTTIAAALGEAVAPSLPSPASGGGGEAAAIVGEQLNQSSVQPRGARRPVPSPACGGGLGRGP